MFCAALNHQIRHFVLSRPIVCASQSQFINRSKPFNPIHSNSNNQFLPSSYCTHKIINHESVHNLYVSRRNFSSLQKLSASSPFSNHFLKGKNILVSRYDNTNDLITSKGKHILSNNKIQVFPNKLLGFPHHVLHTKTPGSTEYTRGAINIPKLILESSPTSVQPYLEMIRFDRPIGTWLLYWPCTWSIALAAQPGCWPDFYMLALFGAGAFFMRGAGCIINDMWDRDFDNKVERTRGRPLTSGKVSFPQAFVFLGSQLAISLAILCQLNWYSICLGAASMGIVITYPAFKRFTYWPQIVLGFAFNYGALLGWAAVRGSCDWSICLPLYFLCHMWTMIYDTIYAHQDKSDDLLIGVKSTALRFGEQTKPWLAGFTTMMVGGLLYVGHCMDMTWPYYTGSTIAIASIVAQLYRLDIDNPQACGDAFRFHFYIGLLMFMTIMLGNLAKPKDVEEKEEKIEGPVLLV